MLEGTNTEPHGRARTDTVGVLSAAAHGLIRTDTDEPGPTRTDTDTGVEENDPVRERPCLSVPVRVPLDTLGLSLSQEVPSV